MRFRSLLVLALLALPAVALADTYYVRGDFYCHAGETGPGPDGLCWGYDAGNQMFDDGLHGDGVAGDGIYGAYIACDQPPGRHEWKIANTDWSLNWPSPPYDAISNALLFTATQGEVIHFLLDTNFVSGEWQPVMDAVQCDHAVPAGATLELIGSAPELGNWTTGVPVLHAGVGWQAIVTIATPGIYEYKFRVAGTWSVAAFGYDYNNTDGRNAVFQTTHGYTDVLFQLDEQTGRIRAIELGPVPTKHQTWGGLKRVYR